MDKEKRGEVFFSGETFRVILFSIGQHKGGGLFFFPFVLFFLVYYFPFPCSLSTILSAGHGFFFVGGFWLCCHETIERGANLILLPWFSCVYSHYHFFFFPPYFVL